MPTAKGQSRNVDNSSLAAIAKKAGAGIHDNDILPEGTSPGHLDEDNEGAAAEGQARLAAGNEAPKSPAKAQAAGNGAPKSPAKAAAPAAAGAAAGNGASKSPAKAAAAAGGGAAKNA